MSLLDLLGGAASSGASPIGAVANVVGNIVDKIWPSPTEEMAAKIALLKEQTADAVALLDAQNRAANAEAASSDHWTSRARPSFLYVMYALILFAIPMGFIAAFSPATATAVAAGFKAWLGAIPTELWGTFGACFIVYTGARSYEKSKGVAT